MKRRKYRICKNDGGWYKPQYYRESKIILGFTILKGKWKNIRDMYNDMVDIYSNKEFARGVIEHDIRVQKMRNKNWTCEKEYNYVSN
jgi:hypothetical protein